MATRMIRWIAVVAVAAAVLPCVARAQTPEERIATALERAIQAGIPATLLESKVAEGHAKGVSADRIAAAVEHRLEVLQHVQERIGEQHGLGADELGLAADAVQSGVSDQTLAAIVQAAPRDRRAVAIAALTQLVQLGQANEVALARVTEAMQRGPQALMDLPAQAAAAAARRGPPAGLPGTGPPDIGAQGTGGPPTGVPPTGGQGRGRGRGGGG